MRPLRRDLERQRFGDRARQRSRHPGRHPQGRRDLRRRSDHDPAPRGRKVRPEFLQGFGRPARRRRFGGQCAVGMVGAPGLARRQGALHALPPWRRRGAAPDRRRRADHGEGQAVHRHRDHLPRVDRNLHHDHLRVRDARTSPARTRVPEFRRLALAYRCPYLGKAYRRFSLRRRNPGVRAIHRPRQDRASRSADHGDGREGGDRRRAVDGVDRQLPRLDSLLHQQHSAARWRHPSRGLPRRAHPHRQRLRQRQRHGEAREGQPHRRGHARRPLLHPLGQGAGPEVLLPDQGQTGVVRSSAGGRIGGRRPARPVVRGTSAGCPQDHRQGDRGRRRPRGGTQGPRSHPAQDRARYRHPARQARRLPGTRSGALRDLPRRG